MFKDVLRKLRKMYWVITGRAALRQHLRDHNQLLNLQIGCAQHIIPDWLNTDVKPIFKGAIYLDASKKFPLPNNTFNYVFSEHTIEHLGYQEGTGMIKECFRILKPGGRIRMATPDLQKILEIDANAAKSPTQEKYIRWITDNFINSDHVYLESLVVNNAFTNWGHNFIYDEKTLTKILKDTGFVKIERQCVGKSKDENLVNLEFHGKIIGDEEINVYETMVLEGLKPGA